MWHGRRATVRIKAELIVSIITFTPPKTNKLIPQAAIYDKALRRKDASGVIHKVPAGKDGKKVEGKEEKKVSADAGKVVNLMAGKLPVSVSSQKEVAYSDRRHRSYLKYRSCDVYGLQCAGRTPRCLYLPLQVGLSAI